MADRPLTPLMQQIMDIMPEWHEPPLTPNEIAWKLGFTDGGRRHGHGGRGGWSGHMGPANRVIYPLTALRRRGLVDFGPRRDGLSGTAYRKVAPDER